MSAKIRHKVPLNLGHLHDWVKRVALESTDWEDDGEVASLRGNLYDNVGFFLTISFGRRVWVVQEHLLGYYGNLIYIVCDMGLGRSLLEDS